MAERRKQRPPDDDEEDFSDERVRRRWINNLFGYWHVCGEKTCRRGRGCAGDPVACFERWWWMTPEGPKIQFRTFIKARVGGMTPQDALRHADAEVERAAEHIARVDAETDARVRALDEAAVARARIPSPHSPSQTGVNALMEGEGGEPQARLRASATRYGEPGEGFLRCSSATPHPAAARRPSPSRGEGVSAPRVRGF